MTVEHLRQPGVNPPRRIRAGDQDFPRTIIFAKELRHAF
jgi:hypothetical protein